MRYAWLLLVGCGHPGRGPVDISTTAPAAYPGTLRDPAQLPHDFFVRQTLTVHAKSPEGKPVSAELDTVVQKQGPELLILGFGPMNGLCNSVGGAAPGPVVDVNRAKSP